MSSEPKHARAFFESIARRYDRAYALDARVSKERMTRVLSFLPPRARVLDLGVGTGRELSALQDAGHDVVGVDVSPSMLAACKRRARPIRLVESDFWAPLPFDDASFDAALALHGTLAHPPSLPPPGSSGDYGGLARELQRVLAHGGFLVAEVPSHAWLERIDRSVDGEASEERRVRRTGPDACVYDDLVVGVSIEAFVPEDARWAELFGASFDVRVEPLDASERLLVARLVGELPHSR
jgi:ubiquinone/menaquinone biosynthesis C-methylase UbiE